MPDKASKKKPEIPQPKPDTILPDDRDAADFGAQEVLHSPSPRSEINQEEL